MTTAAMMPHDMDRRFEPPSLSASLEEHLDLDFDPEKRSPFFGIPSTHSGFRSEATESEPESEPAGPWSPPAWGKASSGGWYRHRIPTGSPSARSRDTSPQYESAGEGDLTIPANIPLPVSPNKQTPRTSPERDVDMQQLKEEEEADEAKQVVEFASPTPPMQTPAQSPEPEPQNPNNYIRFVVNAEVQHRTEPVEEALAWIRNKVDSVTKSKTSLLTVLITIFSIILFRALLQAPEAGPVPDLVKVASLAKSYEPLIYYSENGPHQIVDLKETGFAVQDLGESVRSTNMTSGKIIVDGLDQLSKSLNDLGTLLSTFFANVNGDVDNILITMEWAKRELAQVSGKPISSLDSLHNLLSRVGVLETGTGELTAVGKVVKDLFGQSNSQRTKHALSRTFNEFLNVLEGSIRNELKYCTMIFGQFEEIDQQFLNLQRTVIREKDTQEREEEELLSSLWSRVMGANASQLKKYEKNKQLLSTVRERTVRNKHIVIDYNGKLLQLKANLEILRLRLVSPLVRSNESSTLSVEEQILGLDNTYEYLRRIRENQKQKILELTYGAGSRRVSIGRDERPEVEAT